MMTTFLKLMMLLLKVRVDFLPINDSFLRSSK